MQESFQSPRLAQENKPPRRIFMPEELAIIREWGANHGYGKPSAKALLKTQMISDVTVFNLERRLRYEAWELKGKTRASISFSPEVKEQLENEYAQNPNPSRDICRALAEQLDQDFQRVYMWFRNKKARESKKQNKQVGEGCLPLSPSKNHGNVKENCEENRSAKKQGQKRTVEDENMPNLAEPLIVPPPPLKRQRRAGLFLSPEQLEKRAQWMKEKNVLGELSIVSKPRTPRLFLSAEQIERRTQWMQAENVLGEPSAEVRSENFLHVLFKAAVAVENGVRPGPGKSG